MTDKERRSLEAMSDSMHERTAAVQRELRNNGYRMSPALKAQLQQEEAALNRQVSAISRRLADEAARDVLEAVERDRTANLDGWAASMEARAGSNLSAGASVVERATCAAAVEIPTGAPGWVMLMPAGQLEARDGRRWRLTDADAVVDATRTAASNTDMGNRLRAPDPALEGERAAGAGRRLDPRTAGTPRGAVGTRRVDGARRRHAEGPRVSLPQPDVSFTRATAS